jgi:hypothetical protein
MSTPSSNNVASPPRTPEDVVASIIETLREYKADIQESIGMFDDKYEELQRELEIVTDSLNNLVLSLSELNDTACKTLQENVGPNERTMLIDPRKKRGKRVAFGDVTNIV